MANIKQVKVNNTVYEVTGKVMTGATSSVAGASGSVPAPAAGDQDKFLGGDGEWHPVAGASIDTSITDGTTSQNAPTSQAVAQYVLGKGYLTQIIIPINPAVTPTTNGAMWITT